MSGDEPPRIEPVNAGGAEWASTGIAGLDSVLCGGFPRSRLYLVQGDPGAGKTTLALQYLMAGRDAGERCIYITLSETLEELNLVAASHGWSLEGIDIVSMPTEDRPGEENTFFHPSEVELQETTRRMLAELRRVQPSRAVVDSLTEFRLLAENPLRFRRQVLALKQFFAEQRTTVLLLEDQTIEPRGSELRSLVHGVVLLQCLSPAYGPERRRINVLKLRGVKFRGGFHDFRIETGGIRVFPRLVALEHRGSFARDIAGTGLPELDRLLGGGLDRSTSLLFIGPAGSGKSVIAVQCVTAAAERGERSAVFAFDESVGTLIIRSEGLGMPVQRFLDSGHISISQVDPAELTPGEFAQRVRDEVERNGARIIVIDSLNGYLSAMPEESMLNVHLHELFTYLRQRGVIIISTVAQSGLIGTPIRSPVDVSYIADTVVVFRYFEAAGSVRKAISVVKKRTGPHEATIRELCIEDGTITVSPPLDQFRGVMTGVPVYSGSNVDDE